MIWLLIFILILVHVAFVFYISGGPYPMTPEEW